MNLRHRLRRLFGDTLFKRLMLLMWVALVASHFLSFAAVRSLADGLGEARPMRVPAPGPGPDGMGVPPLSSLPPGVLPDGGRGRPPPDRQPGGSPPLRALWLDYLVRFLVIGGAAWWGAQWLSQPMRRLADASRSLGQAIAQRRPAPTLDEHEGTREVRQAAQVFNTMAQRLHQQFDAQGLLMAAISHDLRTPLARLRLRLETMEPGTQTERCIADLREMDALIGSVLAMVRDQHAPQAHQRVDLRALLQAQVDDRVEQGLAVRIADDSAGDAVVLAQPEALGRILGNLIGNALRHAGSAELSLLGSPGELELRVDDRGPGIPEDQLEAVFRPFYRVDGARHGEVGNSTSGGNGLGLYIARDLAERLGGRLSLSNRPDGGLRARLLLPSA
ncbi:ATP-binding protein [Rhizobacter sp. SG703]|uniref:ATP-binding protein n=1 Tax=Rhizobacter sp. SG703 TaxID=2587140 RepID=UPI001446B662|nr:ATP-binding protein [Rhizobacter sp. SG703]NKI95029.1 signal transduction histidine kinase [Rhizobacter sp. SG703]